MEIHESYCFILDLHRLHPHVGGAWNASCLLSIHASRPGPCQAMPLCERIKLCVLSQLVSLTMERRKITGTCILIIIPFLNNFHVIKGHETFYNDFLKLVGIDSPVFVSAHDFEDETSFLRMKTPVNLIKYIIGKEERQVASHIHEQYNQDESKMILFLDGGHEKLLNIMLNEMRLFNKGFIGLLSESDFDARMTLSLRLDTQLYLYASTGKSTILKEIYAVNGESITSHIGTWHQDAGLSVPVPNIWERRNNLKGMALRVATISFPILHELHYDESGEHILQSGGFFLEVLNILAAKLNFTLKIIPSVDGKWGGMDSNGTWNGLMGMLIRREADIVAAALTITKERLDVTTFSVTLLKGYKTLMSAWNTEPESDFWIYLNIFPTTAWLVCVALVICISLGFSAMSCINYVYPINDSDEFKIMTGFGLALSFFRQIYCEVKLKGASPRIFFLVSAVSSYIIFVQYTAYLTAVSTSGIKESSIKSFGDVINNNYKVVVVDGSTEHEILKASHPGTAMHRVYYNTMAEDTNAIVQSYEMAANAVYSRKKTLFFGNSLVSIAYDGIKSLEIKVFFITANFCIQYYNPCCNNQFVGIEKCLILCISKVHNIFSGKNEG